MSCDSLFVDFDFPGLLDNVTLRNYFKRMHSGDNEAREEIIKHNIELVILQVLNGYVNTGYDIKDLVSVGLIGLIKGVDAFSLSETMPIDKYLRGAINHEIIIFLRSNQKNENICSLENILESINSNDMEEDSIHFIDMDSDVTDNYETKELYQTVQQIVDRLPELESNIVKDYFGFDNKDTLTQKKIATLYNISQPIVCKILRRALIKIKATLYRQKIIDINDNQNIYGKSNKKRLHPNE